jgi:hypothetical protein
MNPGGLQTWNVVALGSEGFQKCITLHVGVHISKEVMMERRPVASLYRDFPETPGSAFNCYIILALL